MAESRRAKDAVDLDLWNKQKHWQQTSEKLKRRLKEKDDEVEKVKASLTIAKNSISRLEREKHLLETRSRNTIVRYCSESSCPNQHSHKPTPVAVSSESSSSSQSESSREHPDHHQTHGESSDLVVKLKSRIEINNVEAMELKGRGSNIMTQELETLHERVSALIKNRPRRSPNSLFRHNRKLQLFPQKSIF